MTASEKVRMLRCASSFVLRRCGAFRGHVPIPLGFRNMSPTPHSSGFARLACGTFSEAVPFFNTDMMDSGSNKG